MQNYKFQYEYGGNVFDVTVKYNTKRQKNIYFRRKDNEILVTCDRYSSLDYIKKVLPDMIPKLKNSSKKNAFFTDDGVYIFGDFVSTADGFVKFGGKSFLFLNKENFYNKISIYAQKYFQERVDYYSKIMNVNEHYKVRLGFQNRQYGSNSKTTHTISLNVILIHYSQEISDTVVVHELAHHFVRNHSDDFYNVVYKYCPDYDYLDRKLRKEILKWLKILTVRTTQSLNTLLNLETITFPKMKKDL